LRLRASARSWAPGNLWHDSTGLPEDANPDDGKGFGTDLGGDHAALPGTLGGRDDGMPASDEFAPPRSGQMSEQVGGAQLEVGTAGDVYPADESSPHADLVAGACRIQEARDDAFGSGCRCR